MVCWSARRQQGSWQWLWSLQGGRVGGVVGVQMVYGESRQNSSRVVVVGGGGAFMIVSSFLPGF